MGNITQITQIQKYYENYFKVINQYKDITRHSLFCLYLNINKTASVYNKDIDSTYTKHYSGVVYDSFDFTPLQSVDPINNTTQLDPNSVGYKFIGESRVVTYSIKTPQIGDLILFPYTTVNKNEIYRVKEISVPLNARNNDKNFFFQLAIEYAPIKDIDGLKILNSFVYLANEGVHLTKLDYVDFLKDMSLLDDLLKTAKFNSTYELYYFEYDGLMLASLDENRILYEFLKKYRNYLSLYVNVPFGILNFENYFDLLYNLKTNEVLNRYDISLNLDLTKINLMNKILSYEQRRH